MEDELINKMKKHIMKKGIDLALMFSQRWVEEEFIGMTALQYAELAIEVHKQMMATTIILPSELAATIILPSELGARTL